MAVNRALKAKRGVYWLKAPMTANGHTYRPASFYIDGRAQRRSCRRRRASSGCRLRRHGGGAERGRREAPAAAHRALGPVRRLDAVGQTRWLLEQFEFPFDVVYPQALRRRQPASKYDVLVFRRPARSRRRGGTGAAAVAVAGGFGRSRDPEDIPARVPRLARARHGREDHPAAQEVRRGGRDDHRPIGTSTTLALPARPAGDGPAGRAAAGRATERELPREKFYVPGSVLQVAVDNTDPVAAGHRLAGRRLLRRQPGRSASSPTRRSGRAPGRLVRHADAAAQRLGVGRRTISRAASPSSRRTYGKGKLYLFGPEITFRGAAARDVQVPLQRNLPGGAGAKRRDGRQQVGFSRAQGSAA